MVSADAWPQRQAEKYYVGAGKKAEEDCLFNVRETLSFFY
jgi:hypothetical protein